MKNTKKVIALVLTVIMLLGTMTMAAFAAVYTATGVEETDGRTNIKYEVTQVAEASMPDDSDTLAAVNNNIYAVTVYAKTAEGIDYLQLPIHYNKNHYDVLALIDSAAMMTTDELEEPGVYVWGWGRAWSDTSAYRRNGTTASTKALARFIGLGNSWASAVEPTVYNYTETEAQPAVYAAWTKNLDTSTYGVMMFNLDEQAVEKNAYFNAINNEIVPDYVKMITIYFVRKDGVSEADCYGDIFGVQGDDKYGVDVTNDKSGLPSFFNSEGAYTFGSQKVNIINAAVETPVKALASLTAANGAKQQQIMFFLAEGATKEYTTADIDKIDYRFIAQFSTSAFPIDYNADGSVNDTDIDEVGFTMAKAGEATEAELKAFDAAGIAALSKDSGTIRKCWTAKISTDTAGGAAFAFSCRIKGIAVSGGTVASEYIVVPYVLANGQVYYGSAMTSGAQARFNAYADTFLAKKNAA